MKVNDYKFWKGRIETAPDDSTGAFDKFVQDSSSMDQEPRNMYNQGSSVDHAVRTIDPVQDSGNKIEEVLKAYGRYRGSRKGKRPMKFKNFFELYATENFAEGGRAGYKGAGLVKAYTLFKNLNKTGPVKGLEEKLIKQYKSEGMEFIEAIKKAQTEKNVLKNKSKNKILDDAMKETDITSDDYVELIDQKIKIIEPEYYADIKRWSNDRPDLADKTRALFFPDWAEAKYGENYAGVLQDRQAKAIRENIDPNFKEPLSPSDQIASDIDDMNTANIDEFFGVRKKNAEGGRAGYEDGGMLVQPSDDGSRPGYGGPGSGAKPGVSKPVGPGTANPNYVSPMKNPETVAKLTKINRLKYQKTPVGERLQWIANNGKNYNNPENFIKAYEKHFNHKIGSKKDVLFNTSGKKALTQVDNLMNTGRAAQDLFTLKKGYNEEELFKASMIQNNPEIKKEFKTLFKDIHKDVSFYSELGPEGIVERLNKGKLLKEFDFIKYGVGSGITRNSLLNTSGVPTEHLTSYQNVRKPLQSLSQIIENLKNPSFAKQFKISPTTATKVRGQLENFFKGEKGLQTDIRKINTQLGDVKFNNIFGGVNFEHTLAKQFGKDYKYLPRNYLLKGQFTTKNFNMMKKDAFDLPLIRLMKQYEQGKVSGAQVQKFIDDFNAKTNNYADFSFDTKKGKLGYTDTKVSYDLSRYDNPNVARQELIDNIKLTQSDTFQKGMSKTLPESKDQLKLFKSKQGKEMLRLLEKLGCGQSAGGRILMSNGGAAMTECALAGKKKLNKGMSVGFDKTEGELAKKILQAGKGLKNLASFKGLLGPAGLAFEVAVSAGLVGYDMLSTGKSFKEAIGSSLFNYALGDKTKIDNKKLRYKGYADAGIDANQIGKISAFENALDEVNNISAEFNKENQLYNAAANEKGRGRIPEGRYQKTKQQQIENYFNQANKNKALIQDLARTQTENRLDKAIDPMVPALMSDADSKRKAMQMTKPSTVGFGNFMDTVFPSGFFSDTTYKEDRDKAVNYMPEVQEYYRGNQFAGGGIAGLSGGDPEGAMTKSMNPDSQGLRSLFNNGKKR